MRICIWIWISVLVHGVHLRSSSLNSNPLWPQWRDFEREQGRRQEQNQQEQIQNRRRTRQEPEQKLIPRRIHERAKKHESMLAVDNLSGRPPHDADRFNHLSKRHHHHHSHHHRDRAMEQRWSEEHGPVSQRKAQEAERRGWKVEHTAVRNPATDEAADEVMLASHRRPMFPSTASVSTRAPRPLPEARTARQRRANGGWGEGSEDHRQSTQAVRAEDMLQQNKPDKGQHLALPVRQVSPGLAQYYSAFSSSPSASSSASSSPSSFNLQPLPEATPLKSWPTDVSPPFAYYLPIDI